METIILGLAINLYTWSNADFFVARKNAERKNAFPKSPEFRINANKRLTKIVPGMVIPA